MTGRRQANSRGPVQQGPKRVAVESTNPRSPRPEPAQSFVDRVMVDGEAPRNRADADAAVMQRGNLGRDDLVNRRLDRLGELSLCGRGRG